MTSLLVSVRQDLTYALRTFGANPGFVAIVAVSVALGIAANTTVFSMVNAMLLGQMPVRDPDRLVSFDEGSSKSYPDFVDYRDQAKDVFEGVGAHFPLVPVSLGGGEPERIWGQLATGNYFSLIGAQPVLGRGFLPDEDQVSGGNPVVVLSYSLWQRRFAGDRGIIGRQVIMNDRSYTVVGVAPRGFTGEARGIISEFWLPLSMYVQIMPDLAKDGDLTRKREHSWLCIFGRLKPGVSREQAAAAVNVIADRIEKTYRKPEPGRSARRPVKLSQAGGLPGGGVKVAMGVMAVLIVVVGLVLMIACANVANLLLARAAARQREIGIRLAVGAGRKRLIRQLLTESVLLAAIGAAGGLLLSLAATRAIARLQFSLPFPVGFDLSPDMRVVSFTAALTVLTGLLFGLAPALRATRTDVVTTLKGESAPPAARRFGMRNLLVVVQVALSLVLLVSAGLFLRSLGNASSIDTGMRADNVLIMAFDPKLHSYSSERSRQFVANLRQRVTALPGVASVSFVDVVPLSIGSSSDNIRSEGGKEIKDTNADMFRVGARYFETLGIPLLRGRDFDARSAADAVIINEIAAKRLFPGEDAVGRRIRSEGKTYQVIGVAGNAKSRTLGEDPRACLYHSLERDPNEVVSFFGTALLVKTSGSPAALIRPVRSEIQALDRNLAVFNVETMREHLEKALLLPRLSATLLTVFGVAGLALATVGLYGVMSYSVRRRTREIGIRMALGAPASGVLRMVAGQGMLLAGTGLAIGLLIAFALSRFTASQLYGISATDTVTFVGVPFLLLVVAFLASLVPARRAARIEPFIALRHD